MFCCVYSLRARYNFSPLKLWSRVFHHTSVMCECIIVSEQFRSAVVCIRYISHGSDTQTQNQGSLKFKVNNLIFPEFVISTNLRLNHKGARQSGQTFIRHVTVYKF